MGRCARWHHSRTAILNLAREYQPRPRIKSAAQNSPKRQERRHQKSRKSKANIGSFGIVEKHQRASACKYSTSLGAGLQILYEDFDRKVAAVEAVAFRSFESTCSRGPSALLDGDVAPPKHKQSDALQGKWQD